MDDKPKARNFFSTFSEAWASQLKPIWTAFVCLLLLAAPLFESGSAHGFSYNLGMFWKTSTAPSPTPSGSVTPIDSLIGVGPNHACAVISDGTVRCWGDNFYGKLGNGNSTNTITPTPITVSGISGLAVGIDVGFSHSCAVLQDGTARCWGYNSNGQLGNGNTTHSSTPVTVSGLTGAAEISLGNHFSCVVLSGGTARCWGYNWYGQLGNGNTTNSNTPVTVSGLSGIDKISAGGDHACAVLSDSTARCWGDNTYGKLGNGNSTNSKTPVTVSGISSATSISAGQTHSCAVLSDGTARCWGENNNGQLGNGSTTYSLTPVTVSGLSGAVAISLGQTHSCALLSDGSARCWGSNTYGQLGTGNTTISYTPVTVSGLSGALAIIASHYNTCAALSDGSARCWGDNDSGQLGVITAAANVRVPNVVSDLSSAVAISAGGYYMSTAQNCAVLEDGTARCWGKNIDGQLGNGNTIDSTSPVIVSGLSGAVAISTESSHSCAVLQDGTARCWGDNSNGKLGNGNTTDSFTPVTVSGISTATLIRTGNAHSCALLSDGTAQCWGNNNYGRLGNGTTVQSNTPVTVSGLSGIVAISTGDSHTCAVLSNGTARCWGFNWYGQLGNGNTTNSFSPVTVSGLSGAVDISAGDNFSCATLSNGTARCWGSNSYGQLGNGNTTSSYTPVVVSGLSGVITIDAGSSFNCAVLQDGTARCWGSNLDGQLGDGSTVERYSPVTVSGLSAAVAIGAAASHSCALLSDGSARCWGEDFDQLGIYNPNFLTGDAQVHGLDRDSSSPLSGITGTTPVLANGTAASTISIQLTHGFGNAWSGVTPTFRATNTTGGNIVGTCSTSNASGVSTCSLQSTYAEVKELWLTSPIQALAYPTTGVTFTAGSATKLVLSGPDPLSAGSCSTRPYQLTLTDSAGNAVAAGSNFTATLSGLGSAVAYSDPQCTQALGTTLGFLTGSNAWNFYLKDSTAETLSLAASASGLTSASLNVTVSYPLSSVLSSITGSSPVAANGVSTSTVTITLKNINNAPVSGVVPTFSATDTGSTNTYGTCSATNASGVSTCTLSSTRAETKTLSLLTPVTKSDGIVTFTAGTAAKLGFTTQPSANGSGGTAFTAQPVVAIQDAYGNTVTAASNSITLSAYTDSTCTTNLAPGTLSATTNPLSTTSGVSTFSGVTYDKKGDIYLKAAASGLTFACSSVITMISPPVFDQTISANNAGGAATYTIPLTTSGTNRLILLAVTWKNTTAMSTVPSGGPGGWTSVGAINQSTAHRTEIFRAFASSQYAASNITITVPSGAKSSAVLISYSNVDVTGTNGSGAIDTVATLSGTTANPSLSITPVSSTQDTIVLGFLGNGNATAPTAGTGYTLQATGSSTGGGATSRTTTSVETRNSLGASGAATAVDFGLAATDWTQVNIVIKGP